MKPGETYDEWHRREFANQYVWEKYLYPEFGVSDNQLVCRIPIKILNCENCQLVIDNNEIFVIHKKTVDYIIANQESFVEEIRKSVFEYYSFLWNDYLKDFEDEIKYPNPKLNDIHIIDSMIAPKAIYMASNVNEGHFGICFKCLFEDEHGLGIEFENYKVKNIGGEDIGFSLYSDY